ncbi:lycopene cyclase domain-containing protein [Umezawaea endophytica]|uniref:Lycopene cyclase domain-containing protein n=1 Tax=Umezawaea endophytica TaxID=1654476 RepID=A0A9X2VWQ8_9PSEU|nr:lycopene cyclase domain-containing protein [Umezawaea endophytica]MCS7483489.1 lycopene cyclase domain-containing protein [Umezawaea endophytica]
MDGEYLVAAAVAAVLTVLVELLVLRTGLFRRKAYWTTMAIVFAFQVAVDGWLTKLHAPVVRYADWAISGVRAPWDIPVEDFLFGFSMVTLTLLLWERTRRPSREGS